MPDAGLDTTPHLESVCEIPPGAGVEWLLVPGVVVGVFIDCHCAAGGVEVTCWVIAAMPELFSEDERVEVLPWILEAVELPPWEESRSPAGVDTRPLPGEVDSNLSDQGEFETTRRHSVYLPGL